MGGVTTHRTDDYLCFQCQVPSSLVGFSKDGALGVLAVFGDYADRRGIPAKDVDTLLAPCLKHSCLNASCAFPT